MGIIRFVHQFDGKIAGCIADSVESKIGLLLIRPVAKPADYDALAALAEHCDMRPAGILGELTSRKGRFTHAWLAWKLSPQTISQPACLAGKSRPLGLVTLVQTPGRWSISWLLVHPAMRRCSVARVIVGHALAHAQLLGAREVSADTLCSWRGAVAFWKAIGFKTHSNALSRD